MDSRLRRRFLLPLLSATIVVVGLSPAAPVRSAPHVLVHCTTPDGGTVYTDRACAFSGARPAPISTALVARLVTEAHVARDQGGDSILPVEAMPADGAPALHRRPAADGCARTPEQLGADLRGALALGDVNRLAESYHWVGMHSREGRRTLDRLARLIGRPAVDSQYYGAQMAGLSDDADTRGGPGGILQLVLGGDAPTVVEFDVERYAGCYFVRFPDGGTRA